MHEAAVASISAADFQQWLGITLDILVLAGVLSLWLLWKRTMTRQKHAETVLKETADQLEIATETLDEALEKIGNLKKRYTSTPTRSPASTPDRDRAEAERPLQPSNNELSQIIEMNKRGDSTEFISRALGLPEAKIRLILKLQRGKSAPRSR